MNQYFRYHMLVPGDHVIVGLSGGADSVALLHVMCELREAFSLTLTAAHINHSLRGEESYQDEAFCETLCKNWDVPLQVKHVNFETFTEEAGRNARYAFFAELAAAAPTASKIALAHTLSDRAETFLLNIARGTALRGLCSIPPTRGNIIRPLIDCPREQIEAYCNAHALEYCQDSSNANNNYRRNYIRNEVLPKLSWNPEHLRRMFAALELDEAYLQAQAQELEDILTAPEPLRHRALRQRLVEQGREPSFARMRELEKQMRARPAMAGLNLPAPPITRKSIKIISFTENFHTEGLADCLDYDTIEGKVYHGTRKPGDSMRLVNGAGHKSFKKLCQEHGVVPQHREHLMMLRDERGIVWIEGMGCAHRCRVTEKSKRIVKIEVQLGGGEK